MRHSSCRDVAVIEVVSPCAATTNSAVLAAAEAIEGLMSLTEIDCNRGMFKRAMQFFTDHPKLSFEDCCLAKYAELSNRRTLVDLR